MAENGNTAAAATDVIELLVQLLPNGSVQVTGPIGNRALCYGILEAAKDAIRNYVVPKDQPVIIPVTRFPH